MINNQIKNAVDKWSNSFLRPLVPPKLLSNSEIERTEDDGAKLIYLKFLYGIRTGRISERPTDGGIGNIIRDINEESLWIYSLRNEEIPKGFKPLNKKDSGIIGTGDIRKCSTCRGQGRVRCKSCGGKVRWISKDWEGNRIENVCSCGDGKQMCGSCDGFGDVEIIILTQREFKLFDTKNSQYSGEVPKEKVKKITGDLVYEQLYDYPLDMVREMLVGGIDSNEFDQLNNAVLDHLKQSIDEQLIPRGDIDTKKIHTQLDALFNSLPNPGKENKVLEHEAMPIRVMVRVENAPVKQIDYKFKDKDYSLWVYGKENSVWKQKAPSTFNYKGIILSILLLGFIGAGTFFYIDYNRSYSSNTSNTNSNININDSNNSNINSSNNIFNNDLILGNWKVDNQNSSNYNFYSNNRGNFTNSNGKRFDFNWSIRSNNNLKIVLDVDKSVWNWNIENFSKDHIVMFSQQHNERRTIIKNNNSSNNKGKSAIITDPDGFTNVRAGKGTNTNIIYELKTNEDFIVYPSSDKWWKVQLNNGQHGYIFHDRVQLVDNTLKGKYPIASNRVLTQNDLIQMSKSELQIMRNEIFARYGYVFQSGGQMDRYFRNTNWYRPQYSNVDSRLSQIERKNIELIQQYENQASNLNFKAGYTNGTNIIIRNGHSTQSKIVGSIKNSGEKVEILDSYYPNNSETLINRNLNVKTNIGTNYNLQKGKAVTVMSRQNRKVKIQFKDKELRTLTATINERYLDNSVSSNWFKIKKNTGEIGWVFGKFINVTN